ncbi:MAG: lipoyl(octanoyl) transferase LipB [Chloroflexi bacterium]|nr:lipoyl(octanoyl) transferase LipB [Chloroflexota bacterium]
MCASPHPGPLPGERASRSVYSQTGKGHLLYPAGKGAESEGVYPCQVLDLGTVEYRRAWQLQTDLVAAVHAGTQPNTLLLLEHPHVYTCGRLSKPEHMPLSTRQLGEQGIDVVETDRGGQVTYHGPGQLVAYPVVNLRGWGGPLKYVRTLEQVIIRSLADFGIDAGTEPGLTGVWVGKAKVAAIGVKISRGIAHHGFSINVNPDLTKFAEIVPCGITDRPVTSMAKQLGQKAPAMAEVQESVARRFGEGMGYRVGED